MFGATRARILSCVAAATISLAATSGAHAQSPNEPAIQITKQLPDSTQYQNRATPRHVVYDDLSRDPDFAKLLRLANGAYHNLNDDKLNVPMKLAGSEAQGRLHVIRFMADAAAGGACGHMSWVTDKDGTPYFAIPYTWDGKSGPTKEDNVNAGDEVLSLANGLGLARAAAYCEHHFPGIDIYNSPYSTFMNSIGSIEGLYALDEKELGLKGISYLTWYANELAAEFKAGQMDQKEFDERTRILLGRKSLTGSFLKKEGRAGSRFIPMMMKLSGADMKALIKSKPTDPFDEMAVLKWIDDNFIDEKSQRNVNLAKYLVTVDYAMVANWAFKLDMKREAWQSGLNGEKGGCEAIVLSRKSPMSRTSFKLPVAASRCFTLEWAGKTLDDELPPEFALIAEIKGGDIQQLEGLQLGADQSFERKIEGAAKDKAEIEMAGSRKGMYRHGIIIENVQSGTATKNWEMVFKPDVAFKDGKMTFIMTNLNPFDVAATKPVEVSFTVGEGVHEVKADLKVTTFKEDDTSCAAPKEISPPIPSGPMVLAERGRTMFGSGDLGFDKAPTFGGKFLIGVPDPFLCSRITASLGIGGLAENLKASKASELVANAPQNVCAARMRALNAKLESAKKGNLSGLQKHFELDFEVTPKVRLTGPGTYPADFSLVYTQPTLEAEGLLEPTYTDGTGTVTVIDQTNTHIRLRYTIRLEDKDDSCEGRVEGTISGEIITPFAMASADDVISYALHPSDVLGEDIWGSMSTSAQNEMIAEYRTEKTSKLRTPSTDNQPKRADDGIVAGCVITPQDIENIINHQKSMLPEDQKDTFDELYAELRKPEYPKSVLCAMKDGLPKSE